uniref:Uncharacterized protein n=1 Tax=Meloidogyne incognita TaxID=6306 RepID=A0A914LNE8_MELIC
MGAGQLTASPTYRRAITLFRIVESGTPWYVSMRLDELNRTIPGRPGFDNSERSYSSATSWAREEDNSLLIPPVHEIRWWRKLFRQFSNRLHKLNPFTSERDWTITSVQVDRISMILFPMSYLVFNIGYWAYYLGKIGRPL